jgi:hypothetical protein
MLHEPSTDEDDWPFVWATTKLAPSSMTVAAQDSAPVAACRLHPTMHAMQYVSLFVQVVFAHQSPKPRHCERGPATRASCALRDQNPDVTAKSALPPHERVRATRKSVSYAVLQSGYVEISAKKCSRCVPWPCV